MPAESPVLSAKTPAEIASAGVFALSRASCWTWVALAIALLTVIPVAVIFSAWVKPEADILGHLTEFVLPELLANTFWLLLGVGLGVSLLGVSLAWLQRTSEFHVVGDTIKQFASEDATVVVGYVIDPEMTDQIRVTVVATGIGRPMAVRGMPPGTQPQVQVVAGGRAARRPLENYADLEIPTHMRRSRRAVGDDVRVDGDESYLDIPAFLRRQAD